MILKYFCLNHQINNSKDKIQRVIEKDIFNKQTNFEKNLYLRSSLYR